MNNNLIQARFWVKGHYEEFVKKEGEQRKLLFHDIKEELKQPKDCIDSFLNELTSYEKEKEGTSFRSVKDNACRERDKMQEDLFEKYKVIEGLAESLASIQRSNINDVLSSLDEFIRCYTTGVDLAYARVYKLQEGVLRPEEFVSWDR